MVPDGVPKNANSQGSGDSYPRLSSQNSVGPSPGSSPRGEGASLPGMGSSGTVGSDGGVGKAMSSIVFPIAVNLPGPKKTSRNSPTTTRARSLQSITVAN